MEQENLIVFTEHKSFTREIEKFNKRYDGGIGYKSLKKLLQLHFCPSNPQLNFSEKVLHEIQGVGANIKAYKIIMRVKNLSSGQSPRVCFRLEGNLISFLCHGSHIDDYRDSKLKELVKSRIKDLDPSVKFQK